MKPLYIFQLSIFCEETVQYCKYCLLFFLSKLLDLYTNGILLSIRMFSLRIRNDLRLFGAVRSRCCFGSLCLSIKIRGFILVFLHPTIKEMAIYFYGLQSYRNLIDAQFPIIDTGLYRFCVPILR